MAEPIVEKFEKFEIKDGKYLGYYKGMPFEIEENRYSGADGNTYIKYYQDGEIVTIIQHKAREWENNRVYGEVID